MPAYINGDQHTRTDQTVLHGAFKEGQLHYYFNNNPYYSIDAVVCLQDSLDVHSFTRKYISQNLVLSSLLSIQVLVIFLAFGFLKFCLLVQNGGILFF
jgi:hypothetical protein